MRCVKFQHIVKHVVSCTETQTIQGVVIHENMRSVFLPSAANHLSGNGKLVKENAAWKRCFKQSRNKGKIQSVEAYFFHLHSGLCMSQYLPDHSSKHFSTAVKYFTHSSICFTILVLSERGFF